MVGHGVFEAEPEATLGFLQFERAAAGQSQALAFRRIRVVGEDEPLE
ncbi:MAG: hypothetical protein IPL90_03170 [Holophagales bacterium]|nr:hypothetical protein [Holophagales bacterium]